MLDGDPLDDMVGQEDRLAFEVYAEEIVVDGGVGREHDKLVLAKGAPLIVDIYLMVPL